MSDETRSPGVSPWDPGESCKVGIGACLPPRKRLLAGLKQSGLLSTSSSYLQSCNGASCTGLMGELKLEVDLAQANIESNGETFMVESTVCKQGESNAVESSGCLKSKKASRRRKSLSVLADCHGSVNRLQSEALSGSEVEKKSRTSKATVLASNGGRESVSSSREIVDAARAAAAVAAKAAAEARAVALDKAQVAAKAAAVAKAALEALAYVAYDDDWGSQSSNRVRKQKRKGYKLNKELSDLFHMEGNLVSGNREKVERELLDNNMDVAQTRAFHASLSPPGVGAGRDKVKEDIRAESHNLLVVDLASAPSDKIKEDGQAHLDGFHIAACPPPPPLDDEKFARQLHRVMNSSPRISRKRAPLESSKKLEMVPLSTQDCIQNEYPQGEGCHLSSRGKPLYKEKARVLRPSSGRADVKVKSMSVINETLNMLQGVSSARFRVLDGAVSCAASHGINSCAKRNLSVASNSTGAFALLPEFDEDGDKLIVNGGSASSCKSDVEARCRKVHLTKHPNEPDVVNAESELRVVRGPETMRNQKASSTLQTGGSLVAASLGRFQPSSQRGGIGEMPAISAKNHSPTSCDSRSDASGSDFETSRDNDQVGIDEDKGRVNVSGFGSTPQVLGDSVEEMFRVRNIQENLSCDKSSRTTRKSLPVSSHRGRHPRRQKALVALANGLSKANQNYGGNLNLSSYIPSPTVL